MSRTLALMIRCSSLASVLFRPHALLAAAPAPGAGGRGEVRTHCRRSDLWVAEDLLGGAVDTGAGSPSRLVKECRSMWLCTGRQMIGASARRTRQRSS